MIAAMAMAMVMVIAVGSAAVAVVMRFQLTDRTEYPNRQRANANAPHLGHALLPLVFDVGVDRLANLWCDHIQRQRQKRSRRQCEKLSLLPCAYEL